MSNVHERSAFQKSKCALGTIGPVDRARVADLVKFDEDKQLTPLARALWLYFKEMPWNILCDVCL